MRVYNTLSRTKEEFVPREPGKVAMYVCGPTVYNHIHIGNARTFLSFDVIRRYLAVPGFDVRVRPEHHRRRRQDHQPRQRGGRPRRRGRRASTPRRSSRRCARSASRTRRVRPKATETIPRDDRDGRAAHRARPRLRGRRRRLLLGAQLPRLRQAVRPRHRRDADAARASTSTSASATRSTSRSGRPPSPASRTGRARGARAVPAGTSSVRRCRRWSWGCPSTSTAAAATSSSRTTRTRSRSPRPRPACRSRSYWLHGGHAADQRREDEQVARQLHCCSRTCSSATTRTVIRLLMLQTHYRSSLDFSDTRLDETTHAYDRLANLRAQPALGARPRGVRLRRARARRSRDSARRSRRRARSSTPRWTTTSTPPVRSPRSSNSRKAANTFLADVPGRPVRRGPPRAAARPRTSSSALLGVLGIEISRRPDVLLPAARSSSWRATSPATRAPTPRVPSSALLAARAAARASKDWARADAVRDGLARLRVPDRRHAAGRPRHLPVAGVAAWRSSRGATPSSRRCGPGCRCVGC